MSDTAPALGARVESVRDLAADLARCADASRDHAERCARLEDAPEVAVCVGSVLECATLCDAVARLLEHERPEGSPHLAPALELCARACEDAARLCVRRGAEATEVYVETCRRTATACRAAALAVAPAPETAAG